MLIKLSSTKVHTLYLRIASDQSKKEIGVVCVIKETTRVVSVSQLFATLMRAIH